MFFSLTIQTTVKKVYMLRCFIISYLAASREHDIAALTRLRDCIVLIRYLWILIWLG